MRKKIIFSFFISAFIISTLMAFEYFNFIQVRNEMRFLEVTDSIRNRSLQIRRHEKNFFLFPHKAVEESRATQDYLAQLDGITDEINSRNPGKAMELRNLIAKYKTEFGAIEALLAEVSWELENSKGFFAPYDRLAPLVEAASRDNPSYVADFLADTFSLPPGSPQAAKLRELDTQINMLRQTGEDIISVSDELDKDARENAEQGIRRSQLAILIFFPFFLLFSIGALLYISTNIVRRLKTLTDAVEKIGERYAPVAPASQKKSSRKDEVDILVEKFNNMNKQLVAWEAELNKKSQELIQSKKLAAIGTMASGVAHELNNPLNNINISAQVLRKQIGRETSAAVTEIVDDIVGQTVRLKAIVGNLLEFAREREPQLKEIELNRLIANAYELVSKDAHTGGIQFNIDSDAGNVIINADPDQLERVFVNLFTNAVAAMEGRGELTVQIRSENGTLKIRVSDTGKGISKEDREKIFDPFFTKKEKGTGLGLAIVMNIIKKHGGNIAVTGEEGKGTVFEITIPKRVD